MGTVMFKDKYIYAVTTEWGPSWPWSYGSRIYNHLSNQCISPLCCCEFESRSGIQHYVIKFVSDCDRWVVFFFSSGFLHQ